METTPSSRARRSNPCRLHSPTIAELLFVAALLAMTTPASLKKGGRSGAAMSAGVWAPSPASLSPGRDKAEEGP